MPTSRFPRELAGLACVALLKGLRGLPLAVSAAALNPLLPAYPLLRRSHARRLEALFSASPFGATLSVKGYYRRRLDLMLRGLAAHGEPLERGSLEISGESHYREALATGRPVALLGLHMGLLETLHRLPEAPADRPFRILTARSFSARLDRYLDRGRERDGKRTLANRSLGPGLREITERKGVLAFMADQVPGTPGASLRLWDRVEMPYPDRLLGFLTRQGYRILPVSTWMGNGGSSAFRFHPPWADGTAPGPALRAFLECAIAEAPDQWNWSYGKLRPATPESPA